MPQRPSFESLFRLSPNAYVLLDPELVIIDANAAYLALTGRSLEAIRGRRLHEAFAVDPRRPEATHVRELLDSLERTISRKSVEPLPVIRYSIALEGVGEHQDRYWSATHTPILDECGEVIAILQHTMDITELHCAATDSLRESRVGQQPVQQLEGAVLWRARTLQDEGNRMRMLFAQAPGFICFLRGPGHVFEFVNDAYQRLTGNRQLIGKTVREGLPEMEGQAFFGLLDHVYATGEAYVGKRMRALVQRQPGVGQEEVFVDFIYQPIIERDGQVSGIFVQGSEVTEQQRSQMELQEYRERLEELVRERTRELSLSEAERRTAEAALAQSQRLEAVGKLTGGIAHDFNNMLQIIGGNLQLLRRSLGHDETAIRRLESAVSGVEKGAQLARQLLAVASRQSLQPQQIQLGSMLDEMRGLLAGSLGSGVRLELDIDSGLWSVLADVGNLQTVFFNLAFNARDAMPGGGSLLLRAHNRSLDAASAAVWPDAGPGDYVLLSVIDDGLGMSAEVRAHAFEPYFTTRHESNSGLGLSMVYGFVRQSGGFVVLESEEQGGTAVHLYLPRDPEAAGSGGGRPASAAGVQGATPASVDAPPAGLDILFVEDDPTLRMLTGEVMSELGHRVTLIESAETALEQLESHSFDVLLTDVGLAGMSGIELARQAQERHPDVDVVIASGYPVDVLREGLRDLRTMLKPYDIHQVRTLLDNLQAERALAARRG
ncbi:MAG: PAS domain-containing protein [Pseudomonas sp.]